MLNIKPGAVFENKDGFQSLPYPLIHMLNDPMNWNPLKAGRKYLVWLFSSAAKIAAEMGDEHQVDKWKSTAKRVRKGKIEVNMNMEVVTRAEGLVLPW